MLTFTRVSQDGSDTIDCDIRQLVIAGWAARDEAAVRHHIDELAALGVPAPSTFPLFYRVASGLLTQAARIEVLGPDTSGEIEPVIVALDDGLWLTVGSDHTDRKAEAQGVALSKQLCAKVIGRTLWKLDDLLAHWDALELRAFATIGETRHLYQAGALSALRMPGDLIERYAGHDALAPGTIMFGGTLGAIGGVRPSAKFEMELRDPVTGRSMKHAYDVATLPVVL